MELDSFTELSSLVRFDSSEGVGGPCGTSRSTAELTVHMNTPKDSRSPVDGQPSYAPKRRTKCLTNERPARNMLRLETAYLDQISRQPDLLER